MRKLAILLSVAMVSLLATACCLSYGKTEQPPGIDVYFSPRGGCQDAIIGEIGAARGWVHVQAYSFTSAPIAKALLDARKRGIKVEVVIDEGRVSEKYSEATFFANQGIPVFADGKHRIAHNKVMVIDGSVVITGSFNFTKGAELDNAENLLVIRSPALAARYENNYQEHLKHSVKCEAPGTASDGGKEKE